MRKFDDMSDTDLFFSVGSSRPRRGDFGDLIHPATDEELSQSQAEHDEAVEEMYRRDAIRPFPFHLPRRHRT